MNKNFLRDLWHFTYIRWSSMIVYPLTSFFIWFMFTLRCNYYSTMLRAGNILYFYFAICGCAFGLWLSVLFAAERKKAIVGDPSDNIKRSFLAAIIAELLKVLISVWLTSYLTIPFNHGETNLDKLHQLVFMSLCYVTLYFALGALAVSISGRILPRIAFCVSYYFLSAGITYYVFGLSANFFHNVTIFRKPFAFNAPLLDYEAFTELHGCTYDYIVDNIFPGEFDPFVFLSYSQLIGMLGTALLFLTLAIVILNKRNNENTRKSFCIPCIGAITQLLLTLEIHFIINSDAFTTLSLLTKYAYNRFSGGAFKYIIFDLPILACAFIAAMLICNRSLRSMLKSLRLFPPSVLIAYFIQFATYWEYIF